ncbi:MAG: GNAT family N-acetyltransferase [Clostridia bacterium]|nr:GNAT family N-acetyltransferase [Clostridia bacterium]
MKIRFMNEEEFISSKVLWDECFPEDGNEFIDLYYRTRTRPEYALGAFLDDCRMPSAMMHLLPYKMLIGGREEPVCFVAGVSTTPSLRGKGLCSALFEEAFRIMKQRGYSYSALQPFDPSFYERFGYRTVIKRRSVKLSYDRPMEFVRPPELRFIPPYPDRLKELYSAFMLGREGYSIRSEAYFRAFIEEYSLRDARIAVTPRSCCVGYVSNEDSGYFTATELFYIGSFSESMLPDGFKEYVLPFPTDAAKITSSAGTASETTEDFSMIKPILRPLPKLASVYYGFDRY